MKTRTQLEKLEDQISDYLCENYHGTFECGADDLENQASRVICTTLSDEEDCLHIHPYWVITDCRGVDDIYFIRDIKIQDGKYITTQSYNDAIHSKHDTVAELVEEIIEYITCDLDPDRHVITNDKYLRLNWVKGRAYSAELDRIERLAEEN